jgi:hypothetical protein
MRRLDINVVGFVVFFIVSQYHNTELIHSVFEISANQSILLALAAMLNIRLERKTVTL